jgi:sn-glycerol 3-phosphate transport system permease protein
LTSPPETIPSARRRHHSQIPTAFATAPTYIYEVGFRFWDTATASALTMVLLAILALGAALQFLLLEKRTHYR